MTTHEIITRRAQLPVYFGIYDSYNQLVPSHWHNHIEVLYLLKGTLHLTRNDEKYTLRHKDLFVVNASDIHYTLSEGETKVLLLQIPYDFLNQAIQQFEFLQFREYFPQEELQEDAIFQTMVEHILTMKNLYERCQEGYQFLFSSNLYLFLHLLFTNYSVRQNSVEKSKDAKHLMRMRTVITYVEQHYMETLSLTEAAALVALNPEYFCRTFKKYMGFSYLEYVNQVRLTHIHKDLLETDDTITTIQERHGFSNYKVFNRMFKEVYGCSPSKLRYNIKK
ncbi:MAG: AraC-type DNA-binding protein [Herbinix sp.]|jgi:AraC-like DNA-binding protein|nr:AraC-type DNA-binding protein [Herbinix sp.]